jgi:hypothetical protein
MTHVSQVFGALDNGDLQLDNLSGLEDSEDENREDEVNYLRLLIFFDVTNIYNPIILYENIRFCIKIKKLIEEGLPNETFDYDSDVSSHDGTKSSIHNESSFVSNKDHSRNSSKGVRASVADTEGLFKTPMNGNGVNLHMLPNTVMGTAFNGSKKNEEGGKNGHSYTPNGNGMMEDTSREGLIRTLFPNSKSNGSVQQNQKNREHDEIEVTNPTISLLHKDHCPQNDKDGLGSGIWLSAENNSEQLKTLLEFRERQIQRSEETIATLTKDKRALNHQIGLMKTEMVRMASQQQETERHCSKSRFLCYWSRIVFFVLLC